MKFLEKLALFIFSLIIIVLSVALILTMVGKVEVGFWSTCLTAILIHETAVKITIGVSIVALLLAIKCLVFGSEPEDDGRNGVTLENSAGKLVISRESLENLIANVVKEVQGIEAISSRTILDKDHNLVVYVTTVVSKDMMIKDVSAQIQDKIKEALSKTADLEVKQVNIKVKNITNKKIKGLPAGEAESEQKEKEEGKENG